MDALYREVRFALENAEQASASIAGACSRRDAAKRIRIRVMSLGGGGVAECRGEQSRR